ncbi:MULTISPECIES: hypothetical protein [Sphingobacterium]|uniref:hypothetical protein n=1 Tax=Sphingobacterium TaxID=28453 RepID=UPI0013DB58CC|nr:MULTISPECIES: hypothetical protein [unclassified Sphingobacterium]
MKRILLALAIAGASLATLSSCTKEYITNNSLPGVSYVYPVKSNQWTRISGTNTFEFRQNIGDLDDRYFQDGNVSVAISYDNNKTTYEIIPATIEDFDYSANYSIGVVRIFAEDIGSGSTVSPPGDMYIKVVLTDNEIGN